MLEADKTHIMFGHFFWRYIEKPTSRTTTTLGRLCKYGNGRKRFWDLDCQGLVCIIFRHDTCLLAIFHNQLDIDGSCFHCLEKVDGSRLLFGQSK